MEVEGEGDGGGYVVEAWGGYAHNGVAKEKGKARVQLDLGGRQK